MFENQTLSEFQKRIYNKHLAVSRTLRKKFFKTRKDFSKIDSRIEFLLKRIEIFFNKYTDVDINTYFIAPYKLYPDTEFFGLEYFASPRGIKAYSLYKDMLNRKSPDLQKDDVLKSYRFIGMFCIQNRINLDDYSTFKINLEPAWVYHLKKGQINCYSLMEFPKIYNIIQEMPLDEKTILLGDFGLNFVEYKQRYNNSTVLKPVSAQAYQKVKFFVDKTLHLY
jgi:hypothetical protein